MKKTIIQLTLLLILISSASAQIIINQQPPEINNFGGVINTPLTIKSLTNIVGNLEMSVICNGVERNYYKNGISLSAGEEKKIETSLVIMKETVGEFGGKCIIKAVLGDKYILSREFSISDIIIVELKDMTEQIDPGKLLSIRGSAIREDGKPANGFVTLSIVSEDSADSLIQEGTVTEGFFSIQIEIPKNMKAVKHLVMVNIHEMNLLGESTSKGFVNYNLQVNQVPTSLEIFFEEKEVIPGEELKVKVILHDQSGEKINSQASITLRDKNDRIIEQREIATDEFLELPIKYNEPPATWKAFAISNRLTAENTLEIKENPKIKVEIINKTIEITNIGNVPYSENVLIKIGDESLNLNISLKMNETKKYVLTAPDGEYFVDIMGVSQSVMLTGNAINIKEAGEGAIRIIRKPVSWIFVILVLGFMAFVIYKKGYKKSFFGYITSKKKKTESPIPQINEKESLVSSPDKAYLSLSIKGDKQNSSIICFKIKNLNKIKKERIKETIQKITNSANSEKAMIYENQENIFFILTPEKTRTFQNEKISIRLAEEIKKIVDEHNKIQKEKIDFGISLNQGQIIVEKGKTRFMSLGDLISLSKKIALCSKGEILLSEKMKEKLMTDVKTEKQTMDNLTFYKITEIKKTDDNKKFIDSFLKRQRDDKNNQFPKFK